MPTRARAPLLALAILAFGLAGCPSRTPASGTSPAGVTLAPEQVAPEYRADWEAVRAAEQADPAGSAVMTAADQLLARDPPLDLRLAAILVKVRGAYLSGDDAIALRWSAEALTAAEGAKESADGSATGLVQDLRRMQALLMARSGDPERALRYLDGAAQGGALAEAELWAGRAQVHGRQGARLDAAFAHAMWRARADPQSAEARYAEQQIGAFLAGAESSALEARAAQDPGSEGATCLLARAGKAAVPTSAPWMAACLPQPLRLGVLLPRSGKLAALGDAQLAAAIAAVTVLAAGNPAVEVIWADSGSDPATARKGAEALLEAGVAVVVGPVGAGNVAAAARVLAGEAAMIVPGEAAGEARAMAPTLEARAEALIELAREQGARSVVVVAPTHSYGTRALQAVKAAGAAAGVGIAQVQTYQESTTSFAQVLGPVLPELRKGAALVVLDRVARMELLLRQLARDGLTAAPQATTKTVLVLSTAEALELAELGNRGTGHEILEGVWMAPVAWPDAESDDFIRAYLDHEKALPGDQALLVWRALARAWQGGAGDPAQAALVRVQGGRLVASPPKVRVQPQG